MSRHIAVSHSQGLRGPISGPELDLAAATRQATVPAEPGRRPREAMEPTKRVGMRARPAAAEGLGCDRPDDGRRSGKLVTVQLVGRQHEKRAMGPCKNGWSGIKPRELEPGKQS